MQEALRDTDEGVQHKVLYDKRTGCVAYVQAEMVSSVKKFDYFNPFTFFIVASFCPSSCQPAKVIEGMQ